MLKKIAVIGCGLRSDCYLDQLRDGIGSEWEIVALADPNAKALSVYQKNFCRGQAREYPSGPILIQAEGGQLDGVIIGSPNALHLASTLPALTLSVPILLEKPVATTLEDCNRMELAYREAGEPPLAVGFVLRYTTFYRKVRELIQAGELGQLLTIEATEFMGAPLTSLYMRGWRRHSQLSGPIILEKCSHDLDILNWLADAPAESVASRGSRTRFVPLAGAAKHCRDCGRRDGCRYDAAKLEAYLMNVKRRAEITPLIPSDNDLCVFNSDKDIWDHQVAVIAYANGVLATFTVCADQPRTTRNLRICGTNGQLEGDLAADRLRIQRTGNRENPGDHWENIPIEHDDSGHYGGDSVIANQFKSMLRGNGRRPLAGLAEGLEAARLALAAEKAARTQTLIHL